METTRNIASSGGARRRYGPVYGGRRHASRGRRDVVSCVVSSAFGSFVVNREWGRESLQYRGGDPVHDITTRRLPRRRIILGRGYRLLNGERRHALSLVSTTPLTSLTSLVRRVAPDEGGGGVVLRTRQPINDDDDDEEEEEEESCIGDATGRRGGRT